MRTMMKRKDSRKSGLSHLVLNASSKEKKRIYMNALRDATEAQMAVLCEADRIKAKA